MSKKIWANGGRKIVAFVVALIAFSNCIMTEGENLIAAEINTDIGVIENTEVMETTKETVSESESVTEEKTVNTITTEKATKEENTTSTTTVQMTEAKVYPLTYTDSTCSIVVEKEWFENAWCYIAKLSFSDYGRFGTAPANGAHLNGTETTSCFAQRFGAVFAVNGDYACPETGNTAIRSGIVYTDKNCWTPAVYNAHTGVFDSPINLGIQGQLFSTLVEDKKVTDSFTFWSWSVVKNGEVVPSEDTGRAQRTTIGSNGKPGEIIVVVSEGRYVDGESAGLTFEQCGRLMKNLGCTTAVPLDGGGSSTMYFNGKILNSAKYNQRAVRDFVYLK